MKFTLLSLLFVVLFMPAQASAKSSLYCSCVNYAKRVSGINVGSVGYAKNHPINSRKPRVGAIVVMRSGYTGHVGVVTAIRGNRITITEANWKRCARSSRTIAINHPSVRGFYR